MKVTNALSHAGFLEATRGRGGGIRLARGPQDINIGAVIRSMEPGRGLVDCTECRLIRQCGLPAMFSEATMNFYATLGKYTLSDAMAHG
jgi:Rrf2 family nitric oxide-sensitive transcriptional repressor